jgi:UDP-N-acetylglucosamine--N-acetylmuramyl-(pentapeptide) pyrophosphoryl-undecaprenol N-acetylglucosamine transferase
VIAAGGTAGHVVPALAVAQQLRAEGAEVAFIGGDRAEAQLVPQAGYRLHAIRVEGVSRSNPLRALRALVRAAVAVPRARRLLRQLGAQAVLGAGGYVAAPVALAARTLAVPVVLTEADAVVGLSNRLLAPLARRVCLAFAVGEDGRGGPARANYLVTGRPLIAPPHDRAAARERLGIGEGETLVVVFGGSLGARSINLAAPEAFAARDWRVLHVCGRRDYGDLSARAARAGYELVEYLDAPAFSDALAASDLAVARAGGSVLEIAAHGVPMILVPYPHASRDHQRANARMMAAGGAAVVIEDGDLSPARLQAEAAALLGDRPRLREMAAAARSLARPDAASRVALELLDAAASRAVAG